MGLMGRPSLAPDAALWLPDSNGIHMMFMRFPIDAVFVGRPDPTRDGARPVLSVHAGAPAWRGSSRWSAARTGVLELPVGTIAASGTAVGDLIALEPLAGRVSRGLACRSPASRSPAATGRP